MLLCTFQGGLGLHWGGGVLPAARPWCDFHPCRGTRESRSWEPFFFDSAGQPRCQKLGSLCDFWNLCMHLPWLSGHVASGGQATAMCCLTLLVPTWQTHISTPHCSPEFLPTARRTLSQAATMQAFNATATSPPSSSSSVLPPSSPVLYNSWRLKKENSSCW